MEWVEVIRWGAAVCVIVASVLVAWGKTSRIVMWAFVLYTIASVAWIGAAAVQDQPALLVQNAVLLCINLYGLWSWARRPV